MKKKTLIAALLVLGLFAMLSLSFFIIKLFRPKVAGLYIESVPESNVVINGQEVGNTPFRTKTQKPGEVAIRLVPIDSGTSYLPFDTKVNLAPNIETVIRREFGESEELSYTELISFEKAAKDETSVTIVTMPSDAQVVIDGSIKAFTPYKTSNLFGGEHTIMIKTDGFESKELKFKTHLGYRLIVYLVLKKEKIVAPSPTPNVPVEVFVEILSTPTGYLRVRKEPSTLAAEVAQVDQGKRYKLVDEDVNTGWYKIEYDAGLFGWVSNQFAKKIDNSPVVEIVPTTTLIVSPTKTN